MAEVSTTTVVQSTITGGPVNDQAFQGWYFNSSSLCELYSLKQVYGS
jgi:hypothetical protein